MNEHELIRRLREHLNYGLGHLDPDILAGLERARLRALAAHARVHVPEPVPAEAWSGAHGGQRRPFGRPWGRPWLVLLMALALAAGALYWRQAFNGEGEEDNPDAAILAGELPLDAYIDHGFHAWLERASER